MRAITASEFLTLWEEALDRLPYERALVLLAKACPEFSWDELRTLSIGQRDRLLLSLQEAVFGSQLTALSNCPRCRMAVEVGVDVSQLKQGGTLLSPNDVEDSAVVMSGGQEFRVRVPNSRDLAAVAGMDPDHAAAQIFQRCVVSAMDESTIDPAGLSAKVIAHVTQTMAALDPQADCVLELACSACRNSWLERLDIVAFLWSDLDAWAKRTLREVHALAGAYGWSEFEILSLSPSRRQLYLAMVSA